MPSSFSNPISTPASLCRRSGAAVLMALCLSATAAAAVLPAPSAEFERATSAFVAGKGFVALDADGLSAGDWYSARRFVGQDANAIRMPDADLDALTKAMLIVEGREPALENARYRISYSVLADADVPEHALALVEVTRFNLVPAMRDQLVALAGADNVAPATAQTRAAHVSWRFTSRSSQGQQAEIVSASRRVLSQAEAARLDCLGESCLRLDSEQAQQPGFTALTTPVIAPAVYQDRWPRADAERGTTIATPVRVAEELFRHATRDGFDAATSFDPARPQLMLLISLNDGAQEHNSKGVLHQTGLMDAEVAEIHYSRLELPGLLQWQQRVQSRRTGK